MIARKLLTILFALLPCFSYSQPFSGKWDSDFEQAVHVFLPAGTDWLLLKAQCYQESRLDPFAVSPAGARGLCQFMPGTWREAAQALDLTPDDVWLPAASIRASAWYMGRLHRTWSAPRPATDRYMLAAASYNAGAGNLIQAQRLCGGRNRYHEIAPCLPEVTGRHSAETLGYVEIIFTRWWPAMVFKHE